MPEALIVSSDGERLFVHRSMGLVQSGFSEERLARLEGACAIGHVRYSTAGDSDEHNADGNITDHLPTRIEQQDKRMRKLAGLIADTLPPEWYGPMMQAMREREKRRRHVQKPPAKPVDKDW